MALCPAVRKFVDVDSDHIEWSGGQDGGPGSPIGPRVDRIRDDVAAWRDQFLEWVSLIAGQPVSARTPPPPNSTTEHAAGTPLWIEDPEPVGNLNYSANRSTIRINEPTEITGWTLGRALLDRILDAVKRAERPATQLLLLRNARVAIQRSEHRLALVDLGSAAEICLWNTFEQTVRVPSDAEKSTWTLGTIVTELLAKGSPRHRELMTDLVDPRNDAIHRANPLDGRISRRAFAIVRELVSDELDEPLPALSRSEVERPD